jgi:hypothetical protein
LIFKRLLKKTGINGFVENHFVENIYIKYLTTPSPVEACPEVLGDGRRTEG